MAPLQPLLFLDFDDVLCINSVYGGFDMLAPDPPADLWQRLFHAPAVATLLAILEEHQPRVVFTTSWLRFMERPGFEAVFRRTGLGAVDEALHEQWEAPQDRGMTRLGAIDKWLSTHHRGEPYVILDDWQSATGLVGSRHHRDGRVAMCEVGVGLHAGHRVQVRAALLRAPARDRPK